MLKKFYDMDADYIGGHYEKTLVAEDRHFSSQVEVCNFINRYEIKPEYIISVNNDDRGNWWLLYFCEK